MEITPQQVVPDVFAEKELGLLNVYCSEKRSGCSWKGPRNALQDHLQMCRYVEGEYASVGYGERTVRQGLEDHRLTQCRFQSTVHCADSRQTPVSSQAKNDRKHEDEECASRTDSRKERSFKEQLFRCESEQIRHVSSLNQQILHVQSSVEDVRTSTERKTSQMRLQNESTQTEVADLDRRATELQEQLVQLKDQQITMKEKTVEACYKSVENVGREAEKRFGGIDQYLRLIGEKMDKLEREWTRNGQRIERQGETLSNSGREQAGSVNTGERQQFAARDRVLAIHDIKLTENSLRLDMMDCKNTNGMLLWKITEVRRRRRDAMSGKTPSIYSQPFYSSRCGYKMCARLYLNGDGVGKDSHLSLFFVIMRGEYDSLLSWPFKQRVTLVLVDQDERRHLSDAFRPDPSSSSFQRPRSEMNIASGCPLFVPLAALETGGYTKDDAMYAKVIVDTTGLFAPDRR